MIAWLTAMALAIAPADSILLRVLAIADFHGGLEPATTEWSDGRRAGGAAYLKAAMDAAAAECDCPTIRVDAGDQMQGTLISNLVYGESSVDILNRLGLQAAALGNHDLDWGVDTLRVRIAEAEYPWLAANVVDSVTGRRVDWIRPSSMVEVSGVRVGVVGYLTADSKQLIAASSTTGLRFGEGARWVRDQVVDLRAEGADFVLLVAHATVFCRDGECRGELASMATALGPDLVDLIVGGHTDDVAVTEVGGVPVMKSGNGGFTLGVVDLVKQADGTVHHRMRVDTVYVDRYKPDPAIARVVAEHRERVVDLQSAPIATLASPLPIEGRQYPLGYLIADAQRIAADADIGFVNNGGIRRSLDAETVTYGDLFAVLPFDNQLVRVTVSGEVVLEALEHAIRARGPFAHVSGITVRYDGTAEQGHRILDVRLANGEFLTSGRRYTIGMPDFMATGGDGYRMWLSAEQALLGLTYRDAVLNYLRDITPPVAAPTDPRFVDTSLER